MNVKEYIESGILEKYVAGELSEQEMLEVERVAMQYPEVKAELEELQEALRVYAKASDKTPSKDILEKSLLGIEKGEEERFMAVLNEEQ